ncbi:MAG: phosphatidylinositol-specific phospholipase C/glycerophosphodiester phosphodiesterase family protein [Verrucomicrobiales bacterium]|nr:phosphatidylinositol-specific phospholipase C/glycerophosphodiester phosphodiesterase family protein [Verrucomicrobiales bacterium]
MKLIHAFVILGLFSKLTPQSLGAEGSQARPIVPLVHAHAHNDYEHTRPLLDALAQGFCSMEADIHLVDGKLLVAHDLEDAKPELTLERLYLEPLRQRAQQNGGRVYRNGPTITLLVDVKSEAAPTWLVLDPVLKQYADILTRFGNTRADPKAVTVIISGNRARDLVGKQQIRYAALDGRLPDLEASETPALIPLISDNWQAHFKWRGEGPLQKDEEKRLGKIITLAHQQGRKVRFWGTPDRAEFWKALSSAGVDLINADDLSGLRAFLLSTERGPEPQR